MILDLINEAIQNNSIITFDYKGEPRKVEPFLTGQHVTTKNDSLRAWFLEGHSTSGEYNTWKLYTISKIRNLQISNEKFTGIRPDYNRNDEQMGLIYESI